MTDLVKTKASWGSTVAAAIAICLFALQAKAVDPLKTELKDKSFLGHLQSGFHFNDKAPNSMTIDGEHLKPDSLQKTEIAFHLSSAKFKTAKATLYFCDDALTFCEPRNIDLKGSDAAASSPATAKPVEFNQFGFIIDNLEGAETIARKDSQLILVDFSARWCPGCVRLENEVFSSPSFKTGTAKLVKVRMDVDRFENTTAKERYRIHGIPALLLVDSEGHEISRLMDYQPQTTVLKFIKSGFENSVPLEQLRARSSRGDEKPIEMIGQRLYAAEDFAGSVDFFKELKSPPLELRDARVQAAGNELTKNPQDLLKKSAYTDALKTALAEEPATTRSVSWRILLIEALNEKNPERKKLFNDGLAVCDSALAHDDKMKAALVGDSLGEFQGYESLYVAELRAELIDSYTKSELARLKAWSVAADYVKRAKIPLSETGPSMRALIFLTSAQRNQEAEALARGLLKIDPGNADLKRRLTRILNQEQKFALAVETGKASIADSYGRNELFAAEQLAKAYIGSKKISEANHLLQSYLNRKDLQWELNGNERKTFEKLLATAK